MDAKQLRWRCRRGVRELDVLFGRYLEEAYSASPDRQKRAFEHLLGEQDPQIMDWLFGRDEPNDKEMGVLIKTLQSVAGLSD